VFCGGRGFDGCDIVLAGCDGLGVEFTVFVASGVLGFEFGEL
jgi:hypothetical protein